MRIFVASILLFVAVFGIPAVGNISPQPAPTAPKIDVPAPSPEMKEAVAAVARIMKDANIVDRMMWGQVWMKASKAVAADSTDTKVVWNTTDKLRQFNETALRIAWRRIAGNKQGKYPGLNEAVEKAFADVLSTRSQEVTAEVRAKYVALCSAIAWAGVGRDQ